MATLPHNAQGMIMLLFIREGGEHLPCKWKGWPSSFAMGKV